MTKNQASATLTIWTKCETCGQHHLTEHVKDEQCDSCWQAKCAVLVAKIKSKTATRQDQALLSHLVTRRIS